MVRRFVGYSRYDTPAELETLNELYAVVRLYVNFFLPSQKLTEEVRKGSRVTKRYDRPQTPFRRLLASDRISEACAARLRRLYRSLNPAQLHREIL